MPAALPANPSCRDNRDGLTVVALIVLSAAALAVWGAHLSGDRPMHVDEAIHAARLDRLWQHERFDYDPHDYHGPTLYYATLPVLKASGATSLADLDAADLRRVPLLVGALGLLLLALLASGLGRGATLAAVGLMVSSPWFGYYATYYIMEMLLLVFTLLTLGAGWRLVRSGRLAWAALVGVGIGLMHATKETCLLIWLAMAVAGAAVWLWGRADRRVAAGAAAASEDAVDPATVALCNPPRRFAIAAGVALVTAVAVSVVAFSVGFTNADNVPASVTTWWSYLSRAGGAGLHAHDWHYYLGLVGETRDLAVLALAAVGLAGVAANRQVGGARPLQRFVAIFAVAMTVIYSAIPYKTPWTFLTALLPLALLAGVGLAAIAGWLRRAWRPAGVAVASLAAVAIAVSAVQSAWSAPTRWRGDSVFAHAQTLADYQRLVEQLESLTDVAPESAVHVIAPPADQWPLPWDLRGHGPAGYWPTPEAWLSTVAVAPPLVVASADFVPALDARLKSSHTMVGFFQLRRDTWLALYVQDALWRRHLQLQGRLPAGPTEPPA